MRATGTGSRRACEIRLPGVVTAVAAVETVQQLVCVRGACPCILSPASCPVRPAHLNKYMHACIHTHVNTYMHACIHTHIHTYTIYMHAYMHACMHRTYTAHSSPATLQVRRKVACSPCELQGCGHQSRAVAREYCQSQRAVRPHTVRARAWLIKVAPEHVRYLVPAIRDSQV